MSLLNPCFSMWKGRKDFSEATQAGVAGLGFIPYPFPSLSSVTSVGSVAGQEQIQLPHTERNK